MRNTSYLALAALILAATPVVAESPSFVIPHQGRLFGDGDTPVEGPTEITFQIYDQEVATPSNPVAPKWTGTYTVNASKGLYSVDLGDPRGTLSGALTGSQFTGPRWLAVKIGNTELAPRLRVGTSPLALHAAEAEHALLADVATLANTVAAGAVGTAQLGEGAVTATKLAAGAVTTDGLLDAAVTGAKVAAGAIDTAALADESVTAAKLAPGAVGSDALQAGAITADLLAGKAVGTSALADGAVTAGQIAARAVGTAAIADGAVTAGQIGAKAVGSAAIADGAIGDAQLSLLTYAKLPTDIARTSNGALVAAQRKVSSLWVYSAGNNFSGGSAAKVVLDRQTFSAVGRGLNVLKIKRSDHSVIGGAFKVYDTCCGTTPGPVVESTRLATDLNATGTDTLVVVAMADEAFSNLAADARLALKRCGASRLDFVGYRESYLLIGVCGDPSAGGIELARPSDDTGGKTGGAVETTQLLLDGSLAGAQPIKASTSVNSASALTFIQSGAFKKMTNFGDLTFRSTGAPVLFGTSLQMNDDIGIGAAEWLSMGCRLVLDVGTAAERRHPLGLDQRYATYNYQWTYSYQTSVLLAPGVHTAYLECEITRTGGTNMNSSVGNRGFETGNGWTAGPLLITAGGANTNQDVFWAREL